MNGFLTCFYFGALVSFSAIRTNTVFAPKMQAVFPAVIF